MLKYWKMFVTIAHTLFLKTRAVRWIKGWRDDRGARIRKERPKHLDIDPTIWRCQLCTCNSKQCLCFSEICLRRACFSFNKLSRHKEPQSSFNSSHRDFSWKITSYCYSLSLSHNAASLFVQHCAKVKQQVWWQVRTAGDNAVIKGWRIWSLTSSKLWSLSKAISLSSCLVCSFSWRLWADISFWAWRRSSTVRAFTPSCSAHTKKNNTFLSVALLAWCLKELCLSLCRPLLAEELSLLQ